MKIGLIPENPMEQAALEAGQIPIPVVEAISLAKARTIMAAVKLGLFDAIGQESLTAQQVAERSHTHPSSTHKLLDALTSAGYLSKSGDHYRLTPLASQWLLKDSPQSLRDYVLMQYLEWDWLTHTEDFVSSGQPYIIHPHMTEDQWGVYARSMRALSGLNAGNVARLTPVPQGARTMLDLGGSHGYNSVVLCRRYPNLKAVVMDLPQAVQQAGPILAREGMGERVVLRAGNALTTDLGVETYDLILMANLIQNFDESGNRDLFRRAARALRPGGVLAIQESFHPSTPENADQTAVILDFLFAMTSPSQTWNEAQIAAWQKDAGLTPLEPIYFPGRPGYGQQPAVKAAA